MPKATKKTKHTSEMPSTSKALGNPKEYLSKRWVFTLNNYTEEELAKLTASLTADTVDYATIGKEKGENGTPHLQGFVNLKSKKRMTGMKALISEAELANITASITADTADYAVIGKEVGENGTPHLQGFINLKSKKRLAGMKALISSRCHLEVAGNTITATSEL